MDYPHAKIEKWFGGKQAAIALTFDDWTSGQIDVAIPALDKAKFPGTFFVTIANMDISPSFDHWGCFYRLYRGGHEIGNHSVTHKDLCLLSEDDRVYEIDGARDHIKKHLPGIKIESFSYPFGSYSDSVIAHVMHNHIGARTFTDNYELPETNYNFAENIEDYYTVKEFRINKNVSSSDLNDAILKAIEGNGFIPCTFHGVYSDEKPRDEVWFDAIHKNQFCEMLDVINQYDVWVTTFSKALKYHRMAKTMLCTPCAQHPEKIVFMLKKVHSENIENYLCSLSLRVTIPDNTLCLAVEQNGSPIVFRQTANTIQFDVESVESMICLQIKS